VIFPPDSVADEGYRQRGRDPFDLYLQGAAERDIARTKAKLARLIDAVNRTAFNNRSDLENLKRIAAECSKEKL
jgi:hypothetical protein